jgi:hypothetical protein
MAVGLRGSAKRAAWLSAKRGASSDGGRFSFRYSWREGQKTTEATLKPRSQAAKELLRADKHTLKAPSLNLP